VSLARAVHPFPSLLVAAVTVGIAFIALDDPPAGRVAVLGVGMVCFQFAIGLANDIIDANEDRAAKPWKAIPRGVLPRRHAVAAAAGFAGAGMLVTSGLPFGAWLVGLGGLACGLLYDVQFKRTAISWLPLAVALPLVPVWVYLAFGAWDQALWWVFPLGGLLGLSLHLANQLPDLAFEPGSRGAAHRIGARRAMAAALGLYGAAAVMASAVLFATSIAGLGALVAFGALFTGSLASRSISFFGRDGFFGLLATSSALMGLIFLVGAG
jgi:4-hydroxybenzoate polyprenyltransferase